MDHELSLAGVKPKEIYPLGKDFRGENGRGETLSFTNYYLQKNGKPFFGISGEFHYSRMPETRWEDELIKMKMCGINVVTSYVFWIHHEEEEGRFDFSGRRDIRRFVELCAKHGLYVILRVGPFAHGEVRNGGLPDWLYGKPFEVRTLNEGFLYYTGRFYSQIGQQTEGLFYKDGGPIIGVQIDNEYMHSSAAWEITTGISDEWVFSGNEGDAYMLRLKELAAEKGLTPAFYTCTAWGGAIAPDSMMPLWGGYSYRPWIFYSHKGEHPATEEYIYQDFHNNGVVCTNDFKPRYKPEDRPYACCEMGGGMMCCYYYRFRFPYKSVDAMANIKMASGSNFLGYYMFQGGSNPLGRHGTFLNEAQVPKISYDYQAALGEFGQVRESYRRLKTIHYFAAAFGDRLCPLRTVLPAGASEIDPRDTETLRYAVRTDGKRGFVFVNNFQDHMRMPDRMDERITLRLDGEEIDLQFSIAGDENAILPFHFDMDGIDLVWATAQPVTVVETDGERTYVFMVPEGMRAAFQFENGAAVEGAAEIRYECREDVEIDHFRVTKGEAGIRVLVVSREMANQMYVVWPHMDTAESGTGGQRTAGCGGLIFTKGALLADADGLRLETGSAVNLVYTYPAENVSGLCGSLAENVSGLCGSLAENISGLCKSPAENMSGSCRHSARNISGLCSHVANISGHCGAAVQKVEEHAYAPVLGCLQFETEEVVITPKVTAVDERRYTVELPKKLPEYFRHGLKDARLQLTYSGDIGQAFIDGRMISDNFANGAAW